jgi:hypothetical protein
MNIAHQLQQIGIFLTQNGFISVLKQMAKTAVTAVVIDNITGQKPLHNQLCPKKSLGD